MAETGNDWPVWRKQLTIWVGGGFIAILIAYMTLFSTIQNNKNADQDTKNTEQDQADKAIYAHIDKELSGIRSELERLRTAIELMRNLMSEQKHIISKVEKIDDRLGDLERRWYGSKGIAPP